MVLLSCTCISGQFLHGHSNTFWQDLRLDPRPTEMQDRRSDQRPQLHVQRRGPEHQWQWLNIDHLECRDITRPHATGDAVAHYGYP